MSKFIYGTKDEKQAAAVLCRQMLLYWRGRVSASRAELLADIQCHAAARAQMKHIREGRIVGAARPKGTKTQRRVA